MGYISTVGLWSAYPVPFVSEIMLNPVKNQAPYFVSLKPVTSSNTLVAYYVTDGARELASLEAAERVRHTLQLLCTMFGPLEPTSLEEKLLETQLSG